jgi:hypothetical protein
MVFTRRFNALAPERVISEVTDLVDHYRIAEVAMLDSNPVDWRRALEIAKGFESKLRCRTFQAPPIFCRMSDDVSDVG